MAKNNENPKKSFFDKSPTTPPEMAGAATADTGSPGPSIEGIKASIPPLPSGGKGPGRRSNAELQKEKESAELVQKIYTAEVWGPLAALPFDLAFLATKYAGFPLSQEERDRTGYTLAQVIKIYADIDPKYLILTAFLSDYLTLAAKKVIGWQIDLKKAKAGKETVSPQS